MISITFCKSAKPLMELNYISRTNSTIPRNTEILWKASIFIPILALPRDTSELQGPLLPAPAREVS